MMVARHSRSILEWKWETHISIPFTECFCYFQELSFHSVQWHSSSRVLFLLLEKQNSYLGPKTLMKNLFCIFCTTFWGQYGAQRSLIPQEKLVQRRQGELLSLQLSLGRLRTGRARLKPWADLFWPLNCRFDTFDLHVFGVVGSGSILFSNRNFRFTHNTLKLWYYFAVECFCLLILHHL